MPPSSTAKRSAHRRLDALCAAPGEHKGEDDVRGEFDGDADGHEQGDGGKRRRCRRAPSAQDLDDGRRERGAQRERGDDVEDQRERHHGEHGERHGEGGLRLACRSAYCSQKVETTPYGKPSRRRRRRRRRTASRRKGAQVVDGRLVVRRLPQPLDVEVDLRVRDSAVRPPPLPSVTFSMPASCASDSAASAPSTYPCTSAPPRIGARRVSSPWTQRCISGKRSGGHSADPAVVERARRPRRALGIRTRWLAPWRTRRRQTRGSRSSTRATTPTLGTPAARPRAAGSASDPRRSSRCRASR